MIIQLIVFGHDTVNFNCSECAMKWGCVLDWSSGSGEVVSLPVAKIERM